MFDYKKEYKEFYMPAAKPSIVEMPPMNYIAVRGKGDPNTEGGDYSAAVGLLYGIAFTIKMSKRSGWEINGFFDYVVPPLEGFWWMDGVDGVDYSRKADFNWISVIRLPDFVTARDFEQAKELAGKKKGVDYSKVELLTVSEGLCVQCLHKGIFDDEPATVEKMHAFTAENGYELDFSGTRLHHEIYLSDPRRCAPENNRTVIRHPVKRASRSAD